MDEDVVTITFQSLLKASHCQGHMHFSDASRGKQCMTNCMMFLSYSLRKQTCLIDRQDLDHILEAGDYLYRELSRTKNIDGLLLFTDLPNLVYFGNLYYRYRLCANYFGSMIPGFSSELGMSLDNSLVLTFTLCSTCLVVFHSAAVSIRKVKEEFYVFDPHSRGDDGLCHTDGKSVLILLTTIPQLCAYLRELAKSLSTSPLCLVQFEVHAVHISPLKFPPRHENIVPVTVGDSLTITPSILGKRKKRSVSSSIFPSHSAAKYVFNSSNTFPKTPRKTSNKGQPKIPLKNSNKGKPKTMSFREGIIAKFKEDVRMGPVYVCSCCTQTWFRKSVVDVQKIPKKSLNVLCLQGIKSEGEVEWICLTCSSNIKEGKMPRCAVANGMGFPTKPPELELTSMEERLISPRIPFMQLVEKPRGGQRSLRGNVVNVPTDVNSTVRSLPRSLNDIETVQVKLKRKLSYLHSVMYESIRPNKCVKALKWLLLHSPLFQKEGIVLNEDWQLTDQDDFYDTTNQSVDPTESLEEATASCASNQNQEESNCEQSDGWTEVDNFNDRLTGNTDTLLHPSDVRGLTPLSFAPGEGQIPLGLFQDTHAEILSFPTLYCGQERPCNNSRKVPVYYSDICRWEIRCFDRRAASCIPNLFFKLKVLQIKQIQDKVSQAMRKCVDGTKKFTVSEVLAPSSFDSIVRLNEGYRVLRTLRGSPAYWESAKKDIFAMIRQLGIPTWFCSFSAAETRWICLLKVLGKLVNNKTYSDEEINSLTWIQKCELIKADPVTCARYFNNRVQIFISTVLQSKLEPLGKIRDFFYRVEFQQRGSPHIHMLVWVERAPIYGPSSETVSEQFIEKHITCEKNPDIPILINYQTHRHARTCRKKDKPICRFGFPLPPMPVTTILQPLDSKDPLLKKASVDFQKIFQTLTDIKSCEVQDMSFQDFLGLVQMTEESYIKAIRSSLTSPKVFLKRLPSEVRINSYNENLLRAWEANIDVQYIIDAYACAAYIVSYISKGQRGMSALLYEASKEASRAHSDLKQQVRHIGNRFLTHVEICAQEAAYLILQIPMRMSSRVCVFINTTEPESRVFLLKPKDVLEGMPMESTNIESDNNIKRYQRRPVELNSCCLADFMSMFQIILPKKVKRRNNSRSADTLPEEDDVDDNKTEDLFILDNDETLSDRSKPEKMAKTVDGEKIVESLQDNVLTEETIDIVNGEEILNHNTDEYIMTDGTVLRKRKIAKVIRYVRYSKALDPENHYREQLMLFFPWRDELFDLIGACLTYEENYALHIHTIRANKQRYEPLGNIIDIVEDQVLLENDSNLVSQEIQHTEEIDSQQQSNYCDMYGCFDPKQTDHTYDLALDLGITRKQLNTTEITTIGMSKEGYMDLARSLNESQQFFFYHVLHLIKTKDTPLYCFLSGGAGVGKSVLTTALYQAVTRFFSKQLGECPDHIKAVLCAPTGKAAHNIGGSTIHSLFCIPANQNFTYKPLDMQQLDTMRVKFRSLRVVFIDEISMVGNRLFNYINRRLQEIFSCTQSFGRVSIIAIGDLFQLKPVMDSWIFEDIKEGYGPLASNLWKEHFQMFELNEIMRQKDDRQFAELLNRLREGNQTDSDLKTLQGCLISEEIASATDIPHLFTTNKEVNSYNESAYNRVDNHCKCVILAIDTVTGSTSECLVEKIKSQIPDDPAKTMGLFKNLHLAENLSAEVCVNVDVEDGLTNGATCLIKRLDFRVLNSKRCSIVWVLFLDSKIGSTMRTKYSHLYNSGICQTWTPILEITRKFSVGRYKACFVTRRQFPLKLASAKTIHKSQGSTMKDLLADTNMTNANIIAITESRLKSTDSQEAYEMPGFNMYRFDDETVTESRSYKGTVIYSKTCISDLRNCLIHDIDTTIATFNYRNSTVQAVFIYCSPRKATVSNFMNFLEELMLLLNTDKPILIMGDTNIDYNNQKSLNPVLERHHLQQVMTKVTTDYGTCLDHVYIKNIYDNFSCTTLESYYSDHKPIVAFL